MKRFQKKIHFVHNVLTFCIFTVAREEENLAKVANHFLSPIKSSRHQELHPLIYVLHDLYKYWARPRPDLFNLFIFSEVMNGLVYLN